MQSSVDRYCFDLKLWAIISKCHCSLDGAFSLNTNNPIQMDKNGIFTRAHTHTQGFIGTHTITFSWIASGCLMWFHIVKTNEWRNFLDHGTTMFVQRIALNYKGVEFEIGVEQFRRFYIEIFEECSIICLFFYTHKQTNIVWIA